MTSPPAERDLNNLHPMFRHPFEAWFTNAQAQASHVRLFVTEARRTLDRQRHLYAIGRTVPGRIVTNTLDSRHRYGLAADLAMQRQDGRLIWTEASWRWLYRVAPVEPYGLRTLDPYELVHVELFYANEAIENAAVHGLEQT